MTVENFRRPLSKEKTGERKIGQVTKELYIGEGEVLRPGETIISSPEFKFVGCAFLISINGYQQVRVFHALPEELLYKERPFLFHLKPHRFFPHVFYDHCPQVFEAFDHLANPEHIGTLTTPRLVVYAREAFSPYWNCDISWRDASICRDWITHFDRERLDNPSFLQEGEVAKHFRELVAIWDMKLLNSLPIQYRYIPEEVCSRFTARVIHQGSSLLVDIYNGDGYFQGDRLIREDSIPL